MTGKICHFESIGDIEFLKNNRARTLRITVKPNSTVKVTVPSHVTFSNAFRFVEEKKDWIKKSLAKIKNVEGKNTLFLPGVEFSTKEHKLEFVAGSQENMIVRVSKGKITVTYSSELQLTSENGQKLIRQGIDFALRNEAKNYLPERVLFLAEQFGFKFSQLRFKNLKSRWGSCSFSNNINLNIHLIRLPEHLIDYVILHELTHTVHKNHGKQFWQMLDEYSGNAKLKAKEMKKYRTQVF
jgi:predicted metal-dependent hydrolase